MGTGLLCPQGTCEERDFNLRAGAWCGVRHLPFDPELADSVTKVLDEEAATAVLVPLGKEIPNLHVFLEQEHAQPHADRRLLSGSGGLVIIAVTAKEFLVQITGSHLRSQFFFG